MTSALDMAERELRRSRRYFAACHRANGATLSPRVFDAGTPANVAQAQEICAGCPVRAECLSEALTDLNASGVRGGLTEADRRELRRGGRAG